MLKMYKYIPSILNLCWTLSPQFELFKVFLEKGGGGEGEAF